MLGKVGKGEVEIKVYPALKSHTYGSSSADGGKRKPLTIFDRRSKVIGPLPEFTSTSTTMTDYYEVAFIRKAFMKNGKLVSFT